ncbi:putative germin-like protein 9-2 [Capsicum chinense]|uniref:Germin-like protein n=1 Tax=Capsicum annuum TaxID=4072 RepID=A0A1U8EHU5_CAPAN|nr:germin-like protein 9-3 [Capsicum annuum]KAF3671394.1 putative germin-like protein 9-2 [Capsicum annuum]PHT69048.1 putative germin-like protein 9-2 [Capsicum annuum]PHU03686.1 putative germin-like protein 9-2 [Capsicum chinense]
MESKTSSCIVLLALAISSLVAFQIALAGDSDILTDFVIPVEVPSVDASYFTFSGLRGLIGAPPPEKFKATKASMAEFPALNGQSVSYAILQYPSGSVNPVHTHPRSAELLLLMSGTLEVGFIDTTNKIFTQTLQTGDVFVFPKGLVHYQYNADATNCAWAISAFGSANAGTVSIPNSVFNTSIPNNILAKSFKTDIMTIQKIKAGLA